jgi:hypothetical protein
MNKSKYVLGLGLFAAAQTYAAPFAYKKISTLYLRELSSPNSVATTRKNDQALMVDRGVGKFVTTSEGVVYQEGNRLKFAKLNDDPKKPGDGLRFVIDRQVHSFDVDVNTGLLAYMKGSVLWVKPSLEEGEPIAVEYSVDQMRVNQNRVFYSQGYRNFILEFVVGSDGRKKGIVTTLKNVPSNSVLAE